MNDLVASLGINNLSKSQVSDMAKDLDQMVEDFHHCIPAPTCTFRVTR
jgi:transposase-like protein